MLARHCTVLTTSLFAVLLFGLMPGRNVAVAASPNIDALLQKGDLAAANRALAAHLKENPKDDNARFGLATVQLMQGLERLMQSLHKYGLRSHQRWLPFVRLPAPRNIEPEEIRYEDMRRIYEELQADLTQTEKTLAGISSTDVKVPIHFAQIRFDFNGDGKAEDGETLWKVFVKLTGARGISDDAAAKFVIHFDRGDVHWLRGYCHLLLGVTDFILAYDWRDNFDRTAQLFFKNVDSAFAYLRRTEEKQKTWFDAIDVADAIAFVHLIRFKLKEPKRMTSALAHLEAMVQQSKLVWKFVEAETDNDHEWIPSATQTGVIPGIRMSPERIAAWKKFLDEFETILKGKKLVPHWRVKDGRGINLRKVFTEPRPFDLVLWIQGSDAKPYLERGPLTKPEFWFELNRAFRGNFVGFAIWLN